MAICIGSAWPGSARRRIRPSSEVRGSSGGGGERVSQMRYCDGSPDGGEETLLGGLACAPGSVHDLDDFFAPCKGSRLADGGQQRACCS